MSKSPWLLLDVSYFGWRSLYTTGDLSHEGIQTGVIFGIFRSLIELVELFSTKKICFCFDRGYDCRVELDERYKATRKSVETDEETEEARRNVAQQLYRLRTKYLKEVGFKNIFWHDGREADDVIASICLNLPNGETAIIVSPDNDLLQLLVQDKVSIWNPATNSPVTEKSFSDEWGISPTQWADVKAIAGCSSDNVIGIVGVGPKGAAQFLQGTLKTTTKKYQSIVSGNDIWKHNLQLVRLPFPGTNKFELQEDEFLEEKWDKILDDLGMISLRGRISMKR